MNVEQVVLDRVLPNEKEDKRVREAVSSAMDIIIKTIKKIGLKAEPILVGSVAKDTYLRNPEIDIFIMFPPDTPREKLEKHGLKLGQFLKNKKKMYAEHPYTRGVHEGFDTEIVPCYAITSPEQKLSAVDRTPYHTKYVMKRLGATQRDQVRLLKAFMKGVRIYGAEAKVQGFSGYLCELLVLKYGTFRDVLRAAERWQPGNVIALDVLPTRIFDEPLIIVDPVDGGRNVASAVSRNSMAILVHAAVEYLKKPKIEFFFPAPPSRPSKDKILKILKNRGTTLMLIIIKTPRVTEDVLYPQIHKASKAFLDLFRRNGFSVLKLDIDVIEKETLLLFEFETFELPKAKKHEGPPVWIRNSLDFQEKWRHSKEALSDPYIEDGKWFVDVRREQVTAAKIVQERYSELSLGKDLDRIAKTSLQVLIDDKALRRPYMHSIWRFLNQKFPWER